MKPSLFERIDFPSLPPDKLRWQGGMMTGVDLEQIRIVVESALGPTQADLKADLGALKAKADSLPDMHFLQATAQRQQTDVLSLRDDVRVLTAIAMRLDTSHSVLLEELRATHAQIARMNDRIRKLEDENAAPPL
jgi:chromosome segregation ATPase